MNPESSPGDFGSDLRGVAVDEGIISPLEVARTEPIIDTAGDKDDGEDRSARNENLAAPGVGESASAALTALARSVLETLVRCRSPFGFRHPGSIFDHDLLRCRSPIFLAAKTN